MVKIIQYFMALFCLFCFSISVFAETGEKGIDDRVESLKKEVLELTRELSILEEELLFPTSTQVVIFVSMDEENSWMPSSIRLEVDGRMTASHVYAGREIKSMSAGGVQRLYQGNVKQGERKLKVVVQGKEPGSRDRYKREMLYEFEKENSSIFIEINLSENDDGLQITAKDWE